MSEWKKLEEHPAWDGKSQPPDVLIASRMDGGFIAIGRVYRYEDGDVRARAPGFHGYDFSHWMPLPPLPEPEVDA